MGLLDLFKKRKKVNEKEQTKPLESQIDQIKALKLSEALENWQKQVSLIEEHPLSQARVLNSQLLGSLNDIINSMDAKLSELRKLDEILAILRAENAPKSERKTPETALEFALSKVGYVTPKDKQVIELLETVSELSSEEVSQKLNLSRSTISYRLNRLCSMGILDKKARGRIILFYLKDFKKN